MSSQLSGPIGFGDAARALADRLPGIDVIISTFPMMEAAFLTAIDRRIAGVPSYGMILWDDPRARVAFELAPTLLKASANHDERRKLFDQLAEGRLVLNDTPCSEFARVAPEHALVAAEFLRLCSGMLVWSNREAERLTSAIGYRPQTIERIAIPHELPSPTRRQAREFSVVVWAADCSPAQAALPAFALEELHGRVTVVCADGDDIPDVRADFVRATDARVAELLADAACVVVASLSDTGSALALAEHAIPLATPVTSGAHELIPGAYPFEPWNWRSTLYAVLKTAGRPTTPVRAMWPSALRVSHRESSEPAPLVTIVVPTYNRPALLRDCLAFHSKQTYPALEILVVNDGGETPADIVAAFPRARLLDLDRNAGPEAAVAAGVRAARGTYLGVVNDDDHLYPDHVERLVDVLERTGAMIAHGNALVRYQRAGDDGAYHDFAYNASTYIKSLDRSTGMVLTPLLNSSWLARREVFELLSKLDRKSQYVEILDQLTLVERFDFIHVDHVTNDWVLREGTGLWRKRAKGNPEELKAVYERFPLPGRPALEELRQHVLNLVATQQEERDFPLPPTITLEAPRPEPAF